MTPGENSQNEKELVDRVKDLESQLKQHVSESKAEREDQYEQIVILKAARRHRKRNFSSFFKKWKY